MQQCEIPGQCDDSVLLGAGAGDSYTDCLDFCRTTEGRKSTISDHNMQQNLKSPIQQQQGAGWFTHDPADSLCLCWEDCVAIDDATCADCLSGETSCRCDRSEGASPSDELKMCLVGGHPDMTSTSRDYINKSIVFGI